MDKLLNLKTINHQLIFFSFRNHSLLLVIYLATYLMCTERKQRKANKHTQKILFLLLDEKKILHQEEDSLGILWNLPLISCDVPPES